MSLAQVIDGWLAQRVAEGVLPGGEVVVTQRTAAAQGESILAECSPTHPPQLYRVYSLTKSMVAAVALTFVDSGELDLDAPVHRYLGDRWRKENLRVLDDEDEDEEANAHTYKTVPCLVDITIRHLLTHTSGLSHGIFTRMSLLDQIYTQRGVGALQAVELVDGGEHAAGFPSLQAFLDQLAACPLAFQPGKQWLYSYQMELIAHVLLKLDNTGSADLQSLMEDRLFGPLGMSNTTFCPSPEQLARANGVVFDNQGRLTPCPPTHFPPAYYTASAGLYSTAGDVAKFAGMLLRRGRAPGPSAALPTSVLSAKSAELLMQNQLRKSDTSACTVYDLADPALPAGKRRNLILPESEYYGFTMGAGKVCLRAGAKCGSRVGEVSWSGAASTMFLVDQKSELVVVMMTWLRNDGRARVNVLDELRGVVYGNLFKQEQQQQQQQQVEDDPPMASPPPPPVAADKVGPTALPSSPPPTPPLPASCCAIC